MTFLWLLPQDLRSFFFRVEDRQAIVVARIQDRGIATYTPVFNRLERRLAEWSAKQSDIELRLEGRPVQISRDLYQIVTDLRTSLGTATITSLVVLAVVYRSARVGLVSIIPNLFPLVATGALLVMVGKSLDLSSVCAFVVCLGIAVDDTIHFLSRFRQEMVETTHVSDAIERTIVGVGSALLMTTVILVAGFATLLLSDLPGHRTFAGMACVTISAALLGDLVALPAILKAAWSSQPDNDTGA